MKAGTVSPRNLRAARRDAWFLAACGLFVGFVAAASGCAPARQRLLGEEADRATLFFARTADVSFPLRASFSGIAEISGRTVPLIAGLHSRTASDETLGFYDPMGHAVLFLQNDGGSVTVTRGPAGREFWKENFRSLQAGPVSFGRILSGAPGYPVAGGEAGRTADGTWVLTGREQTLFSDPSRRLLARAEYDISGKRVTVTYPGRNAPGTPRTVEVEVMGNRIVLRRDAE
ncbi:MAG TPA: hypothetical protein VFU42_05285 [Candidatus Deferrimicrobiaceae bacterium]|nr:hypothetical protein [Candidatus Deferrimicrobiaceae bacterium]